MVVGYRAVRLDDHLSIRESTLSLSGATDGIRFDLDDSFDTDNTFHGAVFGLEIQSISRRRWTADGTLKIAIGATHQTAQIAGSTVITTPEGGVNTISNGLLTQASNIGNYCDNELSAVSEIGLTLRYCYRPSIDFTFGYSALFWSDVLRAGEQIDLGVNPTQIPPGTLVGEPRPAFSFQTSGFWAQAVRFGIESRF